MITELFGLFRIF